MTGAVLSFTCTNISHFCSHPREGCCDLYFEGEQLRCREVQKHGSCPFQTREGTALNTAGTGKWEGQLPAACGGEGGLAKGQSQRNRQEGPGVRMLRIKKKKVRV